MPSTISRPVHRPSGARQSPRNDQRLPATIGETVGLADRTDAADASRLRRRHSSSDDTAGSCPARTRSPAFQATTVGRARIVYIPLHEGTELVRSRCRHSGPNYDDRLCAHDPPTQADSVTPVCLRTDTGRDRLPLTVEKLPVAPTGGHIEGRRQPARDCHAVWGRRCIGWWCLSRPNVRIRNPPGIRDGQEAAAFLNGRQSAAGTGYGTRNATSQGAEDSAIASARRRTRPASAHRAVSRETITRRLPARSPTRPRLRRDPACRSWPCAHPSVGLLPRRAHLVWRWDRQSRGHWRIAIAKRQPTPASNRPRLRATAGHTRSTGEPPRVGLGATSPHPQLAHPSHPAPNPVTLAEATKTTAPKPDPRPMRRRTVDRTASNSFSPSLVRFT